MSQAVDLVDHVAGQICDLAKIFKLKNRLPEMLELYELIADESLRAAAGRLDPKQSGISRTGLPFLFATSIEQNSRPEFRFIAEPMAYGLNRFDRVRVSLSRLDEIFDRVNIPRDSRLLHLVHKWLIPHSLASMADLRRGIVWVGLRFQKAGPLGMTVYFDGCWGPQHDRWIRPFGLLHDYGAHDCANQYESLISRLHRLVQPLGVAVDASNGGRSTLKIYFRSLPGSCSLIDFGKINGSGCQSNQYLQSFYATMQRDALMAPAAASVYYVAFDLERDAQAGFKVDFCNHCLGFSDTEIAKRITDLAHHLDANTDSYMRISQYLASQKPHSQEPPIHDFLSAATRGSTLRLNVYLRPPLPSEHTSGSVRTVVTPSAANLGKPIESAIAFLKKRQLPSGEFPIYMSATKSLDGPCKLDNSTTCSALVLYSLSFLPSQSIFDMLTQSRVFLSNEMKSPGVWQYWTSGSITKIDADIDDTALISFVLRDYHPRIKSGENIQCILANRNDDGLFHTWFRSTGTKNDIDAVVNANVLLYVGQRPETRLVCEYLNRLLAEDCSETAPSYYLDDLFLFYSASRAYFHGANLLASSKESVLNAVVERQQQNGSFGNPLATALAICTALNFACEDHPILESAWQSLVASQASDGSWPKVAAWAGPEPPAPHSVYWGSEELTTALCIEALARITRLANPGNPLAGAHDQ